MKAVLLAAGRGTRMGALTERTPKPLLPVDGRPILGIIIDGLAAAGIHEIVVVTGYLGEQIEAAFGDGAQRGLSIAYRRQMKTDGTGGALLLVRDLVEDAPFLLSWGDILVRSALYRTMVEQHTRAPADVLLSVNPVDDPWRGAAVYTDVEGRVLRIVEKPPRGSSATKWNNAGVFIFSPLVLEYAAALEPSPRGEYELPQAIARMVDDGRDVRAVPVGDFWSDVGTAEDLVAAASFLREQRPSFATNDQRLLTAFHRRFDAMPEAVADAPGRVNLIGEHTDYNGFPVLPLAIDRKVRLAVRRRADMRIVLANVDERYAPREYELSADIPPFADGDWGNYHKAAVQGVLRHCEGRGVRWHGIEIVASGDIPSGAGLSSSSAFVVAAALAFLAANDVELPPLELAEMLARAERYVGTLSGGMDQAVSLLARAGHALRIDFFPLRAEPVALPPGLALVVCGSLVRAEKSAGARLAYNTRVIECRLACRVIEHVLGSELPRPIARLGDLAQIFPERPPASFIEILAGAVPDGSLRLSEVAKAAGLYPGQLARACEVPADMPDRFALLPRARHVFSEAERVGRAVAALCARDLPALGDLMFASHASCRDDYEVSCLALDELVAAARAAGAVGARLTGAGFGGCTVNLVAEEDVGSFLAAIDRSFYGARLGAWDDVRQHRFVLSARAGASVEHLPENNR